MSIHDKCGENITWANMEDNPDRFLPPLEYIGEVFIITHDGVTRFGEQHHGYKVHLCDPDKIAAWQDYKNRLQEVENREVTTWEVIRHKNQEDAWELTLPYICPRCEAIKGEKCISLQLTHRNAGRRIYIKNPHSQRVDLAYTKQKNTKD